jgi:hypothetical protein
MTERMHFLLGDIVYSFGEANNYYDYQQRTQVPRRTKTGSRLRTFE